MMGAANHWIAAALLTAVAAFAHLSPTAPPPNEPAPSLPLAHTAPDTPKAVPAMPDALLDRIATTPPSFSGQAPAEDAAALALESMRLVGVVIGDRGAIALFSGPDKSTIAVSRGGEIGGWKVASLSSRGVRLTRGSDLIERDVFAPHASSATATRPTESASTSEDRDLGTKSGREPASAPPASFSVPPPPPIFGAPKG